MTGMKATAISKVSFAVGDPASMRFDRPFYAIIGRFVLMYQDDPAASLRHMMRYLRLMYQDDPAASLRHMMRYLRESGLVAFQELDSTSCRSWPAGRVFGEAARWLAEALRGSGARPELGLEIHSLFLDCGLPAPKMRVHALVSGKKTARSTNKWLRRCVAWYRRWRD